jgi:dTDP-4-amino-4,6-dideoxygalactose transaminase
VKQHIEDLAIFGGSPAFAEKLHVGRPNIGNREHLTARLNDMLDRRWLSNDGPFVLEFEQRVSKLLGVRNCIATCNATSALEITAKALELHGEVITPSFTFIATAHALQWLNVTPVFCDIDPRTHNLDPSRIEELITPHTTGIMAVHLWGRACQISILEDIARRHRLKLVFDSAHAFGCSHEGRMIGGFGNAEVFSFHATKVINTFEGGAVTTNDDELAAKIRLMRNFGFVDYDQCVSLGTNGKMNEACAAMGLVSLDSLEDFISANRKNYEHYSAELGNLQGVRLMQYAETERNNYHFIVLEVDQHVTSLSRDQLKQIIWMENVLARRYFYPGCHRMEPYASTVTIPVNRLPATERLAESVLALPSGTSVGHADIETICQLLRFVFTHSKEILRKLEAISCIT